MSYQVRTNCVYWSENAAMAQKSPLSNSVFVDQKTYKLKNSYRTDPSPLQVILGTALVVKNSPLPIEYIRVLFELQEPLTTRQYHSEWFKLCRETPYYGIGDTADVLIELLNDRGQFVTKPLLIECPVLSRNPDIIECRMIQKNKKLLGDIMTCWRNLFQDGTRQPGTRTDEEKRLELAFIPTQIQRFDDDNDPDYSDDDLHEMDWYDPLNLY